MCVCVSLRMRAYFQDIDENSRANIQVIRNAETLTKKKRQRVAERETGQRGREKEREGWGGGGGGGET